MTYAIFVTLQLKDGMAAAYRPLIEANARATRADEPDNRGFVVHVAEDEPDRYHLYEVYTDKAALAAHRETAHFQAYVAATKDMIAARTVQALTVVDD